MSSCQPQVRWSSRFPWTTLFGSVAQAMLSLLVVSACEGSAGRSTTGTTSGGLETTTATTTREAPVTPAITPSIGELNVTTTSSRVDPGPPDLLDPADVPDDASLLAAIVASLTATEPSPVTSDEAQCIGERLIGDLGREHLIELGFGLAPWHLLGIALYGGPAWDEPTARRFVTTFRDCSATWELLMISSVTGGADAISPDSLRCTADALDDDVAESMFVMELDRPYDDQSSGTPGLPHLEPLLAAFDRCLTPVELDQLDFN